MFKTLPWQTIIIGWGSTSDSQFPVMPNNLQVFLLVVFCIFLCLVCMSLCVYDVDQRFLMSSNQKVCILNSHLFQYVEMPIVARPDCQEDYSEVFFIDFVFCILYFYVVFFYF